MTPRLHLVSVALLALSLASPALGEEAPLDPVWTSGIAPEPPPAPKPLPPVVAFTRGRGAINLGVAGGFPTGDSPYNPYLLGGVLSGGYTLRRGLYLGQRFDYFYGLPETGFNISTFEEGTIYPNSWAFMAEVGYDFALGRSVVFRPKLGVGMTKAHLQSAAAVAPALALPIKLGDFALTPEVRFVGLLEDSPFHSVQGSISFGLLL